MSGVYWSITAMYLISSPEEFAESMKINEIVEWVFSCYDPQTGGFGKMRDIFWEEGEEEGRREDPYTNTWLPEK